MGGREQNFIKKNGIEINEVLYLTKEGRRTVFHFEDGTTKESFLTIKGILEEVPEGLFEIINKGIAISLKYLDKIDGNVYTMADGTEFTGRVRTTTMQRQNVMKCREIIQQNVWNQYEILEKLPLAFCVIEVVFDDENHGIDFIFRYCNQAMEELEGKPIEDMIDKSFYDVFESGDKKWLAAYADVAVNGVQRVIESYSPEIDANLKIYCYQPKPNFCACVLIKI